MSAELRELRAACRAVERRHAAPSAVACPVCGVAGAGGSAALEQHLCAAHGLSVVPFDNVADLPGFLSFLAALLRGQRPCCPVCRADAADADAVMAHCAATPGHARWLPTTVEGTAQFCIVAAAAGLDGPDNNDDGGADNNDNGDNGDGDDGDWTDTDGGDASDDDDDDGTALPARCLYCDHTATGTAIWTHTVEAHGFDARGALRDASRFPDVYARVAAVNRVRDAVSDRCACPQCDAAFGGAGGHAALLAHVAEAGHWLPPAAGAPPAEEWLVPRLHADGLLALVVGMRAAGGNGGQNNDADNDDGGSDDDGGAAYPMVPTVRELLERGRQQTEDATGQQDDDDDDDRSSDE